MKKRKKTSPIWRMDLESFKNLVNRNKSYTNVLKEFGYSGMGGAGLTLKQRIREENIDCSHFLKNNKGRKFPDRKAIPLEQVMIENSTYNRGNLKKRLIKENILKNQCSNCGLLPIWDNKELIMVLDHINGVNNDHREENLRLLCPNCNSQTSTFSGKTRRRKYNCERCGIKISKWSKKGLCRSCVGKTYNKKKVENRPSKEILLKDLEGSNYRAVGRKYGVSDNCIRKWLK
jgi:Zn finger protein HypA/HybF involved in hydrogenase expression